MSESAQSTVKDFEDDIETTAADDNHTPILPADNHTPILPADNHTPVAPTAKAKAKSQEDEMSDEDGGVRTLDNHTPIAPARGDA